MDTISIIGLIILGILVFITTYYFVRHWLNERGLVRPTVVDSTPKVSYAVPPGYRLYRVTEIMDLRHDLDISRALVKVLRRRLEDAQFASRAYGTLLVDNGDAEDELSYEESNLPMGPIVPGDRRSS